MNDFSKYFIYVFIYTMSNQIMWMPLYLVGSLINGLNNDTIM